MVKYPTILYDFISFQFISNNLISFHFIPYHFISFHIISYHFISSLIISYHYDHQFNLLLRLQPRNGWSRQWSRSFLAERNPEIVASLTFKNSSERPKEARSSSCQEAVSKSSWYQISLSHKTNCFSRFELVIWTTQREIWDLNCLSYHCVPSSCGRRVESKHPKLQATVGGPTFQFLSKDRHLWMEEPLNTWQMHPFHFPHKIRIWDTLGCILLFLPATVVP